MKHEPIEGTNLYRCRYCSRIRSAARMVSPSEPFTVRKRGKTSRAFDAGTLVCNHHLLRPARELDETEYRVFRASCLKSLWGKDNP